MFSVEDALFAFGPPSVVLLVGIGSCFQATRQQQRQDSNTQQRTRTTSCYRAFQKLLVALHILDKESNNCDNESCTEQSLWLRLSYAAFTYFLAYVFFFVAWQLRFLTAVCFTISSSLWVMVAHNALVVRSVWFGLCSFLVALLSVGTPIYFWLDMVGVSGLHGEELALGWGDLLMLASHYLLPIILLAGFMGDMMCCNNSRRAIRVNGDTGNEAIHHPEEDGISRTVMVLNEKSIV